MSTYKIPNGTTLTYPFKVTTCADVGRCKKVAGLQILWVTYVHKHPNYGVSLRFISTAASPGPGVSVQNPPSNDALIKLIARHHAPADVYVLTDDFAMGIVGNGGGDNWVNEKFVDWDTAQDFADGQQAAHPATGPTSATVQAIADILDPPKTGRKKWVPAAAKPAPVIVRFYGVQAKETDKAFLVSINGKSCWFPKSRTVPVGVMTGEGDADVVCFQVYDGEEWILNDKFGEGMTLQFKNARTAIDARTKDLGS